MQVGMHEAKTQLSDLVKKLQSGEPIEVTNRGIIVAELTLPKSERLKRTKYLVERIKNVRSESSNISSEDILSWKDEGRL